MYLGEPEHNLSNLPKVQASEIGEGLSGNIQTIQLMKKIARLRAGDPLVRRLAENILQQYQVKSHHYLDEALAIGDYVLRKVRYLRDPENIEQLTDPIDLIKAIQQGRAQGDCDDMSLLTATLLLSIGHQPYFRAVRYNQAFGNFNHIYVIVHEKNLGGQVMRVVLDCILKHKPIGSEVDYMNGEDYKV
jgi:hypothetical protein